MSTPPPDDPLVRWLSGKRRSERVEVDMTVALQVSDHALSARVQDLSAHGVLVAFPVEALEEGPSDVAGVLQAVDDLFGEGFLVAFPGGRVRRRAAIVRLGPPDLDGTIRIGCRFSRPLRPSEFARLGVPVPK
jgi:hypothetical protein